MTSPPNEIETYLVGVQAALIGHLTKRREQVERYLNGLGRELAQAKVEIGSHERLHASRFNVFDYIDPDENRLSDILADLLNPAGAHGQGDAFLRLMTDALGVSVPVPGVSVTATREEFTTHLANPLRRIDVVLDFGAFGIGIENKPWAGEQTDQVKDYLLHLTRRYGQNFLLVYLTGDGAPPPSVPVAELLRLERTGQFRVWPYPTGFLAWLDACADRCEAEAVRYLLRHFRRYVQRTFTLDVEDWRQPDHGTDQ